MEDDIDEIEDLLEAPYKVAEKPLAELPTTQDKATTESLVNGSEHTNGNGTHTNGNGIEEEANNSKAHDDEKSKDEKRNKSDENNKENTKSSKKSRKDRSRSRNRSKSRDRSKHKKRTRSRSHSRSKKSKRDKSRSKERDRDVDKDRTRDRKRRNSRSSDRDRDRDRDHHRRRKSHSRSRSRSRSRHRRNRSRSRDNSRRHRRSYTKSKSPPKRQRSPELTPEERDVRTVFCMQLSNRIRPRDLEDFFLPCGKVRDVRLITDPRTKRSKGIAYIEFRDVDSVEKAIALSGQRILGVPIICKLTQAEKNRMPLVIPNQGQAIIPMTGAMKLYIGSLHVNINEEMLKGIFEPFGSIDAIVLCKDDFGRSKGYGFIQFTHAEEAKAAMEGLKNFELANRPIKVAPFIEKPTELGTNIAHLDNEELDRAGVNLGPSGKLALMAKLAEGSGIKIPQQTLDAITASASAAALQAEEKKSESTIAASEPQATQCFLLSNMFDLEEEKRKPNWVEEIRDDVIDECTKYGGIVHISIDQVSPEGNIYIKCSTISIAVAAMASLNGRYFAGKLIQASFIPVTNYNQQFPEAVHCTKTLTPSS